MNRNNVRVSGPDYPPCSPFLAVALLAMVFTLFVFMAFFQKLAFLTEHIKSLNSPHQSLISQMHMIKILTTQKPVLCRILVPMISVPWSYSHSYVTLHNKWDFADVTKVTNQLSLR